MARKRSIQSIDAEISKVEGELTDLQARYDKLAARLEDLQEQKREQQAKIVMDAFQKSGKRFDELMTFLQP